jgi:hypothetical protein
MLPYKARREAHRAGVVECALFAMLNSLKSHVGRNVNSPFSNIHAVTFKLYRHSSRIAVASQPTSKSGPVAKSP